jgi:hypothetical protein
VRVGRARRGLASSAPKAENPKRRARLLGCGRTCVTLLRWSADWDTACSLYEQAAAEYNRLGNARKARLALEKAANAQERLNSCGAPATPDPCMHTC